MKAMDALRLHYKQGCEGLAILEYPPICRNVKVLFNNSYYISFPYHYFILKYDKRLPFFSIHLTSMKLAWRRKPLEKLTDLVSGSGLPMGQDFAQICFGDFKNKSYFKFSNWLNYVVNWFWSSEFVTYNPTAWGMSMKQWEEWTKEDPSFIMNASFWQEQHPMIDVLQRRGSYDNRWQYPRLRPDKKLLPYKGEQL